MNRILMFFIFSTLLGIAHAKPLDAVSWSRAYVESLCAPVSESDRSTCKSLGNDIAENNLTALADKPSLHELRAAATSMLEKNDFISYVTGYLKFDGTPEATIRQRIWQTYGVIILPGKVPTSLGVTQIWSLEDLKLLEMGYKKLYQAVATAVGANRVREFSHIWGAGGVLAKRGFSSVGGQFGEVYGGLPAQVNIVADIDDARFTPETVAQRIAHENSHSNDFLLGLAASGNFIHWTETEEPKVFNLCHVKADHDTSLLPCRDRNPLWFKFHETEYAATNSAEFYGKMVDAWVRDFLGLTTGKKYRCLNDTTADLWAEMEVHFIGETVSPRCK